eukprot:403356248
MKKEVKQVRDFSEFQQIQQQQNQSQSNSAQQNSKTRIGGGISQIAAVSKTKLKIQKNLKKKASQPLQAQSNGGGSHQNNKEKNQYQPNSNNIQLQLTASQTQLAPNSQNNYDQNERENSANNRSGGDAVYFNNNRNSIQNQLVLNTEQDEEISDGNDLIYSNRNNQPEQQPPPNININYASGLRESRQSQNNKVSYRDNQNQQQVDNSQNLSNYNTPKGTTAINSNTNSSVVPKSTTKTVKKKKVTKKTDSIPTADQSDSPNIGVGQDQKLLILQQNIMKQMSDMQELFLKKFKKLKKKTQEQSDDKLAQISQYQSTLDYKESFNQYQSNQGLPPYSQSKPGGNKKSLIQSQIYNPFTASGIASDNVQALQQQVIMLQNQVRDLSTGRKSVLRSSQNISFQPTYQSNINRFQIHNSQTPQQQTRKQFGNSPLILPRIQSQSQQRKLKDQEQFYTQNISATPQFDEMHPHFTSSGISQHGSQLKINSNINSPPLQNLHGSHQHYPISQQQVYRSKNYFYSPSYSNNLRLDYENGGQVQKQPAADLFAEKMSKINFREYSNNTRLNINNIDYANQKVKRDRALKYWKSRVISNFLPPIDFRKREELNERILKLKHQIGPKSLIVRNQLRTFDHSQLSQQNMTNSMQNLKHREDMLQNELALGNTGVNVYQRGRIQTKQGLLNNSQPQLPKFKLMSLNNLEQYQEDEIERDAE